VKANRIFNYGQKAKIKSQFQKSILKIKRQRQPNYYALLQQSETPL
jgi:hypothetical protein